MKKTLISVFIMICVFGAQNIFAQGQIRGKETSENASQIYFEIGGPSLIYSFNYDGRFGPYENGIGFRIGVGGAYLNGEGYFALPVQLNYLLGSGGKYAEIGAGVTYAPGLNFFGMYDPPNGGEPTTNQYTYGTFTLGFRKQPLGKKGFTFRAAFTPIISFNNGGSFFPWAGVSWGYRF